MPQARASPFGKPSFRREDAGSQVFSSLGALVRWSGTRTPPAETTLYSSPVIAGRLGFFAAWTVTSSPHADPPCLDLEAGFQVYPAARMPVPAGGHRRAGDRDRGGPQRHGPARHAVPGQYLHPPMSTTAIILTALTAAGLVLLLWAIGRAVTAAGNRIPPARAVAPPPGRTAGRCPDHHHRRLWRRTPGQPRHPRRPASRGVPHRGQHMLPDQGPALARREHPASRPPQPRRSHHARRSRAGRQRRRASRPPRTPITPATRPRPTTTRQPEEK